MADLRPSLPQLNLSTADHELFKILHKGWRIDCHDESKHVQPNRGHETLPAASMPLLELHNDASIKMFQLLPKVLAS